MAYADVTSLDHTIEHLLNSSRISVASSTQQILKNAELQVRSLKRTLKAYDKIKNSSEGVMAADARIRDEARKLEDAIEYHVSTQFLPQSQSHGTLSLNLDHLRDHIDYFAETAEKMEAEYLEELYKPAAVAASSPTDAGENQCELVGISDYFLRVRGYLVSDEINCMTFAITGMAGIGKTAIAKKLFHDSSVKENFEYRAFVRVGQKYQFEEILQAIVAQLNVDSYKMIMKGDEDIREYFKRSLKGRKFLIVLDDEWNNFRYEFKKLLPKDCDESRILVTSRISNFHSFYDYRMRLLSEEESWELLRRKVFGEGECPLQLVKAGKKIAEICEGLPLLILTIAKLLFEAPKNPEYWNEVAEMKNSVFEHACDQIYELLLPSYHYLAQNSKACFLYMLVFPKNYVVRRSRIVNLWNAERFVDRVGSIFNDIVSNNLVVIRQQSSSSFDKAKACNLHVVYRHVSKREGESNKFICILNRYTYADDLIERIEDKRRLAIYTNTLLAIKEVHNSIASVSTLRSMLCTGPYHQYQVPICLELKLLKVLDALTIRFYEFPVEVVKLIQLKYLSLTTNANLPPSIHQLWFLEFLIVHQHLSINRSVAESYVPVEIWELQQLKHLQIVGRNLHHPLPGVSLPNLAELLDVGVQTCTKQVLENMPKLEKLRFQIEWAPDAAQTMSFFDHIYFPDKLTSLGIVVKNPKFLPKPTAPPRLLSISISRLLKLSLSGFGYPWEDMSKITELPRLQVLKLRCYAFRGEKWEATEAFRNLLYLLIEDTDLVKWTARNETFPRLRRLTMKNCHKLRELPLLKTIAKIELVDCNPLAEACAKRNDECDLEVDYSWKKDEKLIS